MFRGLHSLSYLYLEYNVIRELEPAAFSLMPNLQLVFLNNNLLRALPMDAFAGTSLARLNLRNNFFLHLPVEGVLEHLRAVVQVDLQQNPWDCTCAIVPLKRWVEKLSSVIVVGEVICKTPESHTGKDLRSLEAEVISAGLFAFVLRRRRKKDVPFRKRQEVDLTGIQMQFEERATAATPEKPPGHVYDYIPHPVAHMCNNPIYKPREGEMEAEQKENGGTSYRTLLEKEQEWTAAVSTSQLNTIVTVDRSRLHENGLLCPTAIDSQQRSPQAVGFVDCLYSTAPRLKHVHMAHAHPPGVQYPDVQQDARLKETLLFVGGKGFPEQTQSEYLELRAKLQTKPDYLEVLEKSYRF
ncbi:hypothetical protein AOLI_G00092900 [Acnodon oligacanthus]